MPGRPKAQSSTGGSAKSSLSLKANVLRITIERNDKTVVFYR